MVYKAKHNNLYPPYMNPPLQYKCNGGYNFKKDQFKSNFFSTIQNYVLTLI
jgi:hypothetical protein